MKQASFFSKLAEEKEIHEIEEDLKDLKKRLFDNQPSHFSKRFIIDAFFGSLLVGVAFIMKGGLVTISKELTPQHILAIIVSTLLILTAQIYFAAYSRVRNKKERPFPQFWMKRLIVLYSVTIIVSIYLVYIFNINNIVAPGEEFALVIATSMPCALGAAVPSLLKKYS